MLRLEMSYSGVVHQKCRSSTTRLDLLTSVTQLVLLFLLAAAWSGALSTVRLCIFNVCNPAAQSPITITKPTMIDDNYPWLAMIDKSSC